MKYIVRTVPRSATTMWLKGDSTSSRRRSPAARDRRTASPPPTSPSPVAAAQRIHVRRLHGRDRPRWRAATGARFRALGTGLSLHGFARNLADHGVSCFVWQAMRPAAFIGMLALATGLGGVLLAELAVLPGIETQTHLVDANLAKALS